MFVLFILVIIEASSFLRVCSIFDFSKNLSWGPQQSSFLFSNDSVLPKSM
jgi:hypothetical protein